MPELVGPDDPRYAWSRSRFVGRPHEVLPREVARCSSAADVVAALAPARDRGWPFAVRGGGHSNAGHSSTTGLLLDLTPSDGIDVTGDLVVVGGGVRIGRLSEALAKAGRLVPVGSCPSVGVVGAALGGGFGCHGRLHGLTCDALVSAEVVLASGRVVTASETEEPDLFWALRGAGGGNFGVVTRLADRVLRGERGPPARGEGALRPRRRLRVRPVDPRLSGQSSARSTSARSSTPTTSSSWNTTTTPSSVKPGTRTSANRTSQSRPGGR